ncbi:DUF5996 family protein [Streptomyces sp. NPDC054834]
MGPARRRSGRPPPQSTAGSPGAGRPARAGRYSRTAPEPVGLAEAPLSQAPAQWMARGDSHLAVLRYDAARAERDPRAAVLTFCESAYQAGAGHAGWDIAALACPAESRTRPVGTDAFGQQCSGQASVSVRARMPLSRPVDWPTSMR